jgi:hypothetical protein
MKLRISMRSLIIGSADLSSAVRSDTPFRGAAADPPWQGPPLRVWQPCRYRPGGAGATVVSGTSGPFWSPS